MGSLSVINIDDGTELEKIKIPDELVKKEINSEVLYYEVKRYLASVRTGTHKTKDRSEVRGGGKKPWRQKGTGRARHGSIRSPIWVGGAVAHGPKPKSWKKSLNEKMKRIALKSALSLRMSQGRIFVIDDINIEKPKTKLFLDVLKKLKIDGKVSLVWDGDCENILRSARNIPEVFLINEGSFGAYDVIKSQNLIFFKNAILKVQERVSK